ncbi:YolD-like family protein [Paenibacillus kobensis]|uniref:YolD-like family protein n=1 Tax=Paenibacillus kobensis TaxID=59841 RepID=UPI000FD788DE|nr:YolD-like family protein [Paenibacillus kobensis]
MSKKLTGNGFWESSRMMLPEHKKALVEMRKEERRRIRPNIDFDEAEAIAAAVSKSFMDQTEVTIQIYDPFNERSETGVVERVDQSRIRIAGEWIKFTDIIAAE